MSDSLNTSSPTLEEAIEAVFFTVMAASQDDAMHYVHQLVHVSDTEVRIAFSHEVMSEPDPEAVIAAVEYAVRERVLELTGREHAISSYVLDDPALDQPNVTTLTQAGDAIVEHLHQQMRQAAEVLVEQGGIVAYMLQHSKFAIGVRDGSVTIHPHAGEDELFVHAGQLLLDALSEQCPGHAFNIITTTPNPGSA